MNQTPTRRVVRLPGLPEVIGNRNKNVRVIDLTRLPPQTAHPPPKNQIFRNQFVREQPPRDQICKEQLQRDPFIRESAPPREQSPRVQPLREQSPRVQPFREQSPRVQPLREQSPRVHRESHSPRMQPIREQSPRVPPFREPSPRVHSVPLREHPIREQPTRDQLYKDHPPREYQQRESIGVEVLNELGLLRNQVRTLTKELEFVKMQLAEAQRAPSIRCHAHEEEVEEVMQEDSYQEDLNMSIGSREYLQNHLRYS